MKGIRTLFLVYWCLRDACECVWWFETIESGLGDMLRLQEHRESGVEYMLSLQVTSWKPPEDVLQGLGNGLGGLSA